MGRLNRLCGPAVLLWPLLAGAQTPEIKTILERLDRLERENRVLTEEVRDLRAKLDGGAIAIPPAPTAAAAATPAEPPPTPTVTVEEQLQIQGQRIEDLSKTKVEASQRFSLRVTGFALFNAFVNSKKSGGFEEPVLASPPSAGRSGATLRQSIIGLEFGGPETLWGGKVHGSLFADFSSGSSAALTFRLRTASIEIDWKNRSFMAGLDKPIFNPREPSSLAQVAVSPLTGAGNLWLWLPQARVDQNFHFTSSTGLRARVGVLQTREAGPYPGTGFSGIVEAARPALEGRFEFFHNFDDERKLEIASGFHTSTTHSAGFSVPSRVYSADLFYNPWRPVEFSGFFYTGENVAPLGSGYQQGFGVYYHEAEAVHSTGGWGQVTIHAAKRVDLHLFTGQQDDRNSDLVAGRIGKNLSYGGNIFYRLAPNLVLAWETSQLRTLYLGQGIRINNHHDLSLAYYF